MAVVSVPGMEKGVLSVTVPNGLATCFCITEIEIQQVALRIHFESDFPVNIMCFRL